MRLNKYILIFIILIGLFVFKLAVLLWFLDNGMDITDGGTYMLWSKYYDQYQFELHRYYAILLRKLVFFIEPGVINYRLLRIGTELLSLLLFAAGFWKWSRCERSLFYRSNLPLAFLFFGGALGSFLSLFSRVFSYNDFTNLNVTGAFGLFLWFLGQRSDRGFSVTNYIVLSGIGFFIGLQFFVKLSASLLLGVFLLLMIGGFHGTRRLKVISCALIGAGILLAAVCFFLAYGHGPLFWWADFKEGWRILHLLGYGWDLYWDLYIKSDLFNFLKFFTPAFLTTLATWNVLTVVEKRKCLLNDDLKMSLVFVSTLLPFGITLYLSDFIIYDYVKHKWHFSELHSVYFYPLAIVLFLLPPWFKILKNHPDGKWVFENCTIIGAILLLPYVMMLGTDSSLVVSVYGHLIPWMVLLFALMYLNMSRLNLHWFPICLFVVVIAFSQFHFMGGIVLRTYRVLGGLFAQRYEKLKNSKESIWLDKDTYSFMYGIQQALYNNGFRKGDPIIALTDMPGVVFFLEGFSPGTPWYFSGKSSVEFNCFHLRENIGQMGRSPFLLLNENLEVRNLECLKESVAGFPHAYDTLGQVWNPFLKTNTIILAKLPDNTTE
ncbi:MAG: hypothetical protein KatS3mg031_2625 [Chitinophagales bacterium]|nr:MAG: hypothetical protein KatS3mg031_2625 [Chitinophagales bacterium]